MGRREVTTAITMLVLCGIVAFGAFYGWRSLFAEVPESGPEPTSSCANERLSVGDRLRSGQVRVSVFNAGDRSGLADTVATALQRRGFRIAVVDNAPSDSRVTRVQVRSKDRQDVAASLVARQFGEQLRVRLSGLNLGRGVDVVVGNRFRRLAPATRSIRVGEAQQVCLPGSRS
ncbi:MAG: hypothetical protein AVDCRST_MAG72-899 [uncultured Nocardioidaceae bacterium]|uniref:LytR/CpsA/Psr regulator C-terminal domain-containing protein n=1 Tax=uncultured Nocardioidaceae bacterium TaxID=253824 RepID=A0A6J4LVU3_9ACTN|nr:MAG: hypothetical protein AVDCRST_MAG72-899 [uncultured Nocardioidaceae bacterium]